MFRAAYALAGDAGLAEDATQEAFVRALARWRRLGEQRWVAGWVMTTALNVVRRQLRQRPAEPTTPTPHAPHELVEARIAVRHLPRRQQQAVVLHYLIGMPVAEVARSMGCRDGTVKAHLAKARRSLAHELDDTSTAEREAGVEDG